MRSIAKRCELILRLAGSANPGVVASSNVPSVTGIAMLPTTIDVVTPVNVNVAVPPPDVSVTEFVPDPVQVTIVPQVNRPLELSDTLKTRSPFGSTVKGSA